ncbi:MAG: hypothetical protein PHN69_02475 [Candidatus Pacebacteria bacterium]|nr:hypothetical protein [Candidatus Paceibacterota bacterium]
MSYSQKRFERDVILECDLVDDTDEGKQQNLDALEKYMTIQEIYSDYGRDLGFEFREQLLTLLGYVFSQFEKEDIILMELKYKRLLSYRQISEITKEPLSTTHYKLKKIDKKLKCMFGRSI